MGSNACSATYTNSYGSVLKACGLISLFSHRSNGANNLVTVWTISFRDYKRLGPLQMVPVIITMAIWWRKILKCNGKPKNKEENHTQSHRYIVWPASVRKILRKGPAKTVPNLQSTEI